MLVFTAKFRATIDQESLEEARKFYKKKFKNSSNIQGLLLNISAFTGITTFLILNLGFCDYSILMLIVEPTL